MPIGGGKGGAKGGKGSPASLSNEAEFKNWAEKERKKKKVNYFPKSPLSPNGK
jgi:hypothetical protein